MDINLHRLTIATATNTTFVTPSKGKEKKGNQKGKDKTPGKFFNSKKNMHSLINTEVLHT